jgi:hypothetical protein
MGCFGYLCGRNSAFLPLNMAVPFLSFSSQHDPIRAEVLAAVAEVVRIG